MKQLCYERDLHEAVLRLGLSHPKPRSATAPLAWGYNSGASTRLYYPQSQAYFTQRHIKPLNEYNANIP